MWLRTHHACRWFELGDSGSAREDALLTYHECVIYSRHLNNTSFCVRECWSVSNVFLRPCLTFRYSPAAPRQQPGVGRWPHSGHRHPRRHRQAVDNFLLSCRQSCILPTWEMDDCRLLQFFLQVNKLFTVWMMSYVLCKHLNCETLVAVETLPSSDACHPSVCCN